MALRRAFIVADVVAAATQAAACEREGAPLAPPHMRLLRRLGQFGFVLHTEQARASSGLGVTRRGGPASACQKVGGDDGVSTEAARGGWRKGRHEGVLHGLLVTPWRKGRGKLVIMSHTKMLSFIFRYSKSADLQISVKNALTMLRQSVKNALTMLRQISIFEIRRIGDVVKCEKITPK